MEKNKPINNPDETKPPNNEQQLNTSSADEPIVTTAETSAIINPTSNIKEMEVHHHAHDPAAAHHKKTWKDYFWEFLMLFLAVFCGFLAEYQLEHTIENQREKKYILSMIEDAQTDTANIQAALDLNRKRILSLDSMAKSCFSYGYAGISDSVLYHFLPRCWRHPDFASPTERTMLQLKNAGGMRLISKKIAADFIIAYDDFGKKLVNQQTYYERYLNEIVDEATTSVAPAFSYSVSA